MAIKDPTTSRMHCYSTSWNIVSFWMWYLLGSVEMFMRFGGIFTDYRVPCICRNTTKLIFVVAVFVWHVIISAEEGHVFTSVCLSVRWLTESYERIDKISWSRGWPRDQGDKFWWRSGLPSGFRSPKSGFTGLSKKYLVDGSKLHS